MIFILAASAVARLLILLRKTHQYAPRFGACAPAAAYIFRRYRVLPYTELLLAGFMAHHFDAMGAEMTSTPRAATALILSMGMPDDSAPADVESAGEDAEGKEIRIYSNSNAH